MRQGRSSFREGRLEQQFVGGILAGCRINHQLKGQEGNEVRFQAQDMEKDSVQTSLCSAVGCQCLRHNQKKQKQKPRDCAQHKKTGEKKIFFFVFLVGNRTPWPSDEIQCRAPRLRREGGREPGLTTVETDHLHSAPWNARCGWCSTPDSDSSPQVTSCLFSLSCDPKILTGEAWHSCLGLGS